MRDFFHQVQKICIKYRIQIMLVLAPIAINYFALSWHMPGVRGDLNSWIGFFGSYLGLIGAVYVAFFQIKKQREHDEKKEKENNPDCRDFLDSLKPVY